MKKKGIIFLVLIVIFMLTIAFGIIFFNKSTINIKNQAAFNNFVSYSLEDQKDIFMRQGQTLMGSDLDYYRVDNIIETKKDDKLRKVDTITKKYRRIYDKVVKINKQKDDKSYILAGDLNSSKHIIIYINLQDTRFSNLSETVEFDLICKGLSVDTFEFGECMLPEEAFDKLSVIIRQDTLSKKFETIQGFSLGFFYSMYEDRLKAPCMQSKKQCLDVIDTIVEENFNTQDYAFENEEKIIEHAFKTKTPVYNFL